MRLLNGLEVTTLIEHHVLSIVDQALFIEPKGKKRTIYHKDSNKASRCTLEDIPEKQDSTEFNLYEHLKLLEASKASVAKFTF